MPNTFTHTLRPLRHLGKALLFGAKTAATSALSFAMLHGLAVAQVYNGGGVEAGVGAAENIQGVGSGNLRQQIGNIVNTALNYAALIAVAVIIIAGFFLILSLGDEGRKDTARRIIIYTGIGLIILLTAKIIVAFFIGLAQ